ncbi:hypothetical protein B0H17DRAFT_1196369 [Mycena rosella]|uniref:Ubiquitin 3 binding protein But2 C-terminal domain-containing protein n=1 Tax=Mycena rosella TaxID=1033263 RepID=A0AAD7DUI4_MYCRO|nr:hypothetical protein B0H17DRAFT_1196369 [Mycena rosella]
MPYISLFLCAAFTLVNIVFTISSRRTAASLDPPVTHKNIHLLRRPSQYIRFDEVQRPSEPIPRQFNNYPIAVAQIDAADEGRIFAEDARAYMSPIGTVVPGDRRVLVTPTISTVVQFRTIDWGMEDCELHVSLPALSLGVGPKGVSVVVHRLNQTYPLDLATLSYRTRPPRVAKLASVQLSRTEGTVWHRRFACAADDVLTFELECSQTDGGDCLVEWWQKRGHVEPVPAVYLTQHATA